jgi:hypothetical protein
MTPTKWTTKIIWFFKSYQMDNKGFDSYQMDNTDYGS